MSFPESLHLFCRVVDNFGDIGVCWRLARQLAGEYGIDVSLWVDDLESFRGICRAIDPGRDLQRQQGVTIRRWHEAMDLPGPQAVGDVVIEAFGCALPPAYIAAMAERTPTPVWINLEYLSAEPWVEDCHAMQSLYPSLPLTKYFFFPGFSGKTGGLLLERGLDARRRAFQQDPAAATGFLDSIGVTSSQTGRRISLFCYPSAPVASLFSALEKDQRPTVCLVPQGVAAEQVAAFLRQAPSAGACATRGSLTLQVAPFLDQPDYDKLLWSCDLNFVRGEDSLVRAQWAGRPFIWHIYPQEEQAHLVKLDAFLDRYTAGLAPQAARAASAAWRAWNTGGDMAAHWETLCSALPQLNAHMPQWMEALRQNGDLGANLLRFVKKIG